MEMRNRVLGSYFDPRRVSTLVRKYLKAAGMLFYRSMTRIAWANKSATKRMNSSPKREEFIKTLVT